MIDRNENEMMLPALSDDSRNNIYYDDNVLDIGGPQEFSLAYPSISGRLDYPTIAYTSASDLADYMIATVGAFPRDTMDQRIVGYLRQNMTSVPPNTGAVVNGQTRNVRDTFAPLAPSCASPLSAASDTDDDGMPDSWERRNGLRVGIADHNGVNLSAAGYRNIEVYLNELSDRVIAAGASTGAGCDDL